MVFPLVPSPMGGNLGATTASFFRLDPLGVAALEPLIDLIPGLTPLRVTFDMVDSESATYTYDVTEHPLQSFLDVTTNVHKRLEKITITGTLGATPPLQNFPPAPLPSPSSAGGAALAVIPPPPVPGSSLRLDLLRIRNLKSIADARAPIMVVTPRLGLGKCFIESIVPNWNPNLAESSTVTITVKEARLVNPLTGGELLAPDYPAQSPGNNASSGGGQSQTSAAGESASPASTDAGAPRLGGTSGPSA